MLNKNNFLLITKKSTTAALPCLARAVCWAPIRNTLYSLFTVQDHQILKFEMALPPQAQLGYRYTGQLAQQMPSQSATASALACKYMQPWDRNVYCRQYFARMSTNLDDGSESILTSAVQCYDPTGRQCAIFISG